MLTAIPTGAQVVAYLDADDDLADLAAVRAANVAAVTRAYCRGIGFGPDGEVQDDIAAVIVSATAREMNTSPGVASEDIGAYRVAYGIGAAEYTLRELAVLNAYRRSAT